MSKRISVQWRITILTALLIAAACVSLNLLLFYSGSDSMDALNGFVVEYKTGNQQEMTIEIPQENMQAFFSDFSQQVSAEKVRFERMGWCITALVTLLSAVIAYFVSGRALKPAGRFCAADRADQRGKPDRHPPVRGHDRRVPAAEPVGQRHARPSGAVI